MKTKLRESIILIAVIIITLFLASNSLAYTCFQESFNTINQTGIDGNCGQKYNGTYGYYNQTTNLQTQLYITYYKPINATNMTWNIQIMNNTLLHINIPNECFNNYLDKIILGIYSLHNYYGQNDISLSCANETFNFNETIQQGSLPIILYNNSNTGTVGDYYSSGWNNVIIDGNYTTCDYGFDVGSGGANRGIWAGITDKNTIDENNWLALVCEESVYWELPNIPENSVENETIECNNCTTMIQFKSDSFLLTITELDILYYIIIGILIYFPFYMNNKKYFALYIFVGIILGVYTIYLEAKLLNIFIENTFFVNLIKWILLSISISFFAYGIVQGWSNLMNMIFGEKDSKGMRKK